MVKKRINPKEIKRKDVLIAIDISNNDINYNNLKSLLKIFDTMTKDYDMKGKVLLFDSKVEDDLNIENIDQLAEDKIILSTEKANFQCLIDYIKNKEFDIFKIFVITDGNLEVPQYCNYDVSWITDSNKDFGFGNILKI